MIAALARKRLFFAKLFNLCVVAALVVGFSLWAQKTAAADAAVREQIQEAERAANKGPYATDGVFTGSAQGYGGPVTVEVTIENGYIEDVTVTSAPNEDSAYLSQAQSLIPNILDQQTSDVDTVSGCTYSSTGIINATTEALKQSISGEGGA